LSSQAPHIYLSLGITAGHGPAILDRLTTLDWPNADEYEEVGFVESGESNTSVRGIILSHASQFWADTVNRIHVDSSGRLRTATALERKEPQIHETLATVSLDAESRQWVYMNGAARRNPTCHECYYTH